MRARVERIERERLVDIAKRFVRFAAAAHGISVIAQDVGLAAGKRNRDLVFAQRFAHLQSVCIGEPQPGPRDRQVWRLRNRGFRILQRLGPTPRQLGGGSCRKIRQMVGHKGFQRIGAPIVRIERNGLVEQLKAALECRNSELPAGADCGPGLAREALGQFGDFEPAMLGGVFLERAAPRSARSAWRTDRGA